MAMKKERLVLELISNVHFNNEIGIDLAQTSPMTYLPIS